MNELVKASPQSLTTLSRVEAQRLIDAWRKNRSQKTLDAYDLDLRAFQQFVKTKTPTEAASRLIGHGFGKANELADAYKDYMMNTKKYSSATINRRLAALRSLTKIGQRIGMIEWSLSVDNAKHELRRDTRGPEPKEIAKIIEIAASHFWKWKALRDVAMIRLMFNRGLRRESVAALNLKDVDLSKGTIRVQLKGHREPEVWTIPEACIMAIREWMSIPLRSLHLNDEDPLFISEKFTRLSGSSIWKIIRDIGVKAGIKGLHPHSFRHSAASAGLDKTNGNYQAVSRFLGHKDAKTVMLYDDKRKDLGGDVARMISEE